MSPGKKSLAKKSLGKNPRKSLRMKSHWKKNPRKKDSRIKSHREKNSLKKGSWKKAPWKNVLCYRNSRKINKEKLKNFLIFIDWSHPTTPHTSKDAQRSSYDPAYTKLWKTRVRGLFSGEFFFRFFFPQIFFQGSLFPGFIYNMVVTYTYWFIQLLFCRYS